MDQKPAAPKPTDDSPGWWLKFLARTIGTFGGLVAIALGLFACISFHALCLVAGLTQMVVGLLVVAMEAPCCCPCLDFIDRIGSFSESQPHWRKTLIYGITSIIPVLLCFELSTFFGCVMIFITALLYGIMALGKKIALIVHTISIFVLLYLLTCFRWWSRHPESPLVIALRLQVGLSVLFNALAISLAVTFLIVFWMRSHVPK